MCFCLKKSCTQSGLSYTQCEKIIWSITGKLRATSIATVLRMSHYSAYRVKPNMEQEANYQLEQFAGSHSDLNNESESKQNIGLCSDPMDVKLEIKEEYWWANETEPNHQPQTNFEFVPALKTNKQDTFSGENSIDEYVAFPESPRLTSEAVYNDGSGISTSLIHSLQKGCHQVPQADLDFKTVVGNNVNEQSLKKESNCTLNCKPEDDCNLSSKLFKTSKDGKQLHKCEFCEKIFKHKSLLEGHVLCHSGTTPFKCNMCEKSFKRKSEIKRHNLIHSGAKPYKCDICKKGFSNKQILTQHIFSHSGSKPYKCDSCEKSFNRKSTLARHSLCHSGTRPFKCDRCETTFYQKSDLKKHTLWHSGIKPYKCDSCDKRFSDKSNLTKHIFCHSGSKPYKCDICGKSFNRKSALTRHGLRHFRLKTKQM